VIALASERASGPAAASAPGKLIIAGEYAVLDGSPALVLAVNRRAEVRFDPAARGISAFLDAVADQIAADGGDPTRAKQIAADSSAFYRDAQKLGLGSSAAVTVAATALALGSPLDRARVLEVAMAAHAQAQGARGARGSGADVAAAVYGGMIQFQPGPTPVVTPRTWPATLVLLPFFTGHSADTATLVAGMQHARQARPRPVQEALDAIAIASKAACEGLAARLLENLGLAAFGMDRLADATGLPLVPACVTQVHTALRGFGIAKTTGAGGGDVAIAVIRNTSGAQQGEHATATRRYIIEAGGLPLDLALDHTGVDLHAPAQ
jgi:phosphomevalonate kinase